MNKQKANGYAKLLVFFLVAVILIFAVGLVADGWQKSDAESVSEENNDKTAEGDSEKVDDNKDPTQDTTEEDKEPEVYVPIYFDRLSGLETTEILALKRHTAFIFDSSSPLYGISSAVMLIEIPVENGQTRLIAYINDYNTLGKIGSLTATRDYISAVGEYFGGSVLCFGKDSLTSTGTNSHIFDLSNTTGFYYTEYNIFTYTNGNLLLGALAGGGTGSASPSFTLPYSHVEYGKESIRFSKSASSIILPYSELGASELKYSVQDKKYTYIKGGNVKNDLLNSNICKYDNCIVLFSDTVTYETESGTEMELKTGSSGKGYYFTEGTYTEITYSVDNNGVMSLLGSTGEKLTVNRGKTYIGYLKSSSYKSFTESLK